MPEVNLHNAGEAAKKVANGEHLAEPGPASLRKSLTIGALATAMAKAQSELKNPPKDSINPHYKSKYADLATVRDVVIPTLAKHGLAVMQFPSEFNGMPSLTTLLTHTSGEWVESTICLRSPKSDPQGVGSALTYMRRYSLQSLAGVAADDDDDGHAASQPKREARPVEQPKAKAEPQYADKDNLPIRASLTQGIAKTRDKADLDAYWVRSAVAARDNGQLSRADWDSLIGAAKERAGQFAAPVTSR